MSRDACSGTGGPAPPTATCILTTRRSAPPPNGWRWRCNRSCAGAERAFDPLPVGGTVVGLDRAGANYGRALYPRRARHRIPGMSDKRILIVGGGAAGLAAAYDLKRRGGVFSNGS